MTHLDRKLKQTYSEIQSIESPKRGLPLRTDDENGTGEAKRLFRKAKVFTKLAKIRSIFSGQQNRLIELDRVIKGHIIDGWNYLGIQDVPIEEIVGSEDPHPSFDKNFNPLRELDRDRWLDIATAMVLGINIPPIELIQLPMGYFAQSGHYRISVAQTRGEPTIKAYITTLDLRQDENRILGRDGSL
jgi:hypothetical protein